MVKNPSVMPERWVWSPDCRDPLEEGMVTHSSVLAWKILWTEEPGHLQYRGSQRIWHNWSDLACRHAHTFIQLLPFLIYLQNLLPFEEEAETHCQIWKNAYYFLLGFLVLRDIFLCWFFFFFFAFPQSWSPLSKSIYSQFLYMEHLRNI